MGAAVIPGFGGGLVSHAFMEGLLDANAAGSAPDTAAVERRIARWWQHVDRTLGPASSARSVFDIAVVPLLTELGLPRPAVSAHAYGLAGVVPGIDAVLLCVPWESPLPAAWRDAARFGLGAGASWAVTTNGHALRIVDGRRMWSRACLEFEFCGLCMSPRGIQALRLVAEALAGRPQPLRQLVADADAHASQLCHGLGRGVLEILPRLAAALSPRSPHGAAAFEQALTIVYRILFLLFAEARGLVPAWHALYREAYTVDALTTLALDGRSRGLWEAVQAIARLAHTGCTVGDLEVTAFNGRLFSPRHAPLAAHGHVPDRVVGDTLLALATEVTPHGRRRIAYHDLGVEQLGSVYERVLEYEPHRGAAPALARTSRERKNTGSFYTPRSITEYLVRRTLEPLVTNRSAADILRLRILDPAMGSGAFLVAACRWLAEQCEHARIRDGQWRAGDITPAERATLRRQVAEQCVYGVDLNPTAVQLARLSLWLTTLAAHRPLTFLDHHLAAGNSLIGARLTDLSRPVASGRAASTLIPLPLFDEHAGDLAAQVLPARLQLALASSDSVDEVRAKERLLASLADGDGLLAMWQRAADVWCAATLVPPPAPAAGVVAEWMAAATGGVTTLPRAALRASLDRAGALARAHGAFHFELTFPEVFFDDGGRLRPDAGFDAVIGNPPWDMLRADTGESRAVTKAGTAAALRFFRRSGAYQAQGRGHVNRYQLFLERALQLVRPGGRIGMVLPSGIGSDQASAPLRRHLLERTTIDTWLGFDNRRRIFPIHRSMRFVVMSTTAAGATEALPLRCGLTDASDLDAAGTPPLALARTRLQAWSPDLLTIPDIADADTLRLIATIRERIPTLSDRGGWQARFGRELNATEDRSHFVRHRRPGRSLLPIVEGKQLTPFQVAVGRSEWAIPRAAAQAVLGTASFDRPRLAYRDVAGATNTLTLIAAELPPGTVSTHTVFVSKAVLPEPSRWCLLALLNSLVANFLIRVEVSTHVTAALMARLPVPRPPDGEPVIDRLAALARDVSVAGIAAAPASYAALNAIAADLYGVSVEQFRYVVATFPLVSESIRAQCLDAYERLARNQHGTTEPLNH
jgi:hypothetical protein